MSELDEQDRPTALARVRTSWQNLKSRSAEGDGQTADHGAETTLDEATGTEGYTPYVPFAFRLSAAWSWRFLIVVAAIALLVYGLSFITIIVIPLLIALLLSALLTPLTNWLENKGVKRALATVVTFLGAIVIVAGLLTLVGQQLVVGFADLRDQAVQGYQTIYAWLETGPFGIDGSQIPQLLDRAVTQATDAVQKNSSSILGGALAATSTAGNFAAGFLLALFTTFFFLLDGRRIFGWLIGLLPARARSKAQGASTRGWQTLVQYVRVQIMVAGADAIGITIGAFALGIPLAFPIGVLVFLGSFIPIVGAVATGAVAVLVALVAKGWVTALLMLAVVLLVQQLESNFLQPFIMGKAVSVHPLAVVLAVAAGSFIAGIPGALFAVPLVAVLNTSILYLAGRDPLAQDKKTRDVDPEPSTTPPTAGEIETSDNSMGDDPRPAPGRAR
ncbi:AI-2E family transporter [Saxibacter everestensis]|uniref:AI-2E family transporter n=1 Tax=Saxibacter everestensis TaxID=2909229 RepID=A0ABY8QNY2_9MICO|nr:AI-2E family transporter [Brevibacteriaceae bacterium ZFBP1038]